MGLLFLQSGLLAALPLAILMSAAYIIRLRKSVAIRVTGERFEVLKAAAVQRGTAGHFVSPILLLAGLVLLSTASADPLYTFGGGSTFLGPIFAAIAGVLLLLSVMLRRK